jgi:hypothetical protein
MIKRRQKLHNEFGSLRHFWFYMGVAALFGILLGVPAGLFDWSYATQFWTGFGATLAIGTFACREVLFSPRTEQGPRGRTRGRQG